METPIINLPITSKYKEVVEAVRDNRTAGMCHAHAVESAMNQYWYKFILNDREILLAWFNGKFAA